MDAILQFLTSIKDPKIWVGIVLIFIIVLIFSIVTTNRSIKNGSEATLLWGLFTVKPNESVTSWKVKYDDLNKQFDVLNINDKLKSDIIKLFNTALIGAPYFNNGESINEKKRKIDTYYNLIFPAIISLFKRETDNNHRIGIFIPRGNNTLALHKGYCYPPESRDILHLHNSRAGYCYTNKEVYYCADLTQEPTFKPNPNTNYQSLVCIPITYKNEVIGVFNIDGEKKNSFHKDHINYINYLVNVVAPVIYLELAISESYQISAQV
ncbi:hypothetical protein CN473_12320 [Bacillus thuringiensis]|uniref:GAF domain-containing protein n=1 Tax=Bacillus thuringiensis TaxID=1428 RepID=UPI000BF87033|nr:GAF domain-containing protein [Bacillus thuringiensis]PEQ53102.1 hypothetical protein CN473_12320 [Bacillus thuringiensis]